MLCKDLIEEFVDALSATTEVGQASAEFVDAKRAEELERIITEEDLDLQASRGFVEPAFRDGAVQPTGTAITTILSPVCRCGPADAHAAKKQTVLGKLGNFFGLS